jgi:hypothetical protein
LDLAHAEANRHHAAACRHDAAAEDAARTGIRWRCRNRVVRTREFVDQIANFIGGTFLEQELQNNSDGFLSSRPVYADIGDDTSDQFVHLRPTSPAFAVISDIMTVAISENKFCAFKQGSFVRK